jgi:hypothetical protein
MKIIIKYLLFFSMTTAVFFTLLFFSSNPEKQLEGQWKELSWEYEKVDKPTKNGDSLDYKKCSDFVKKTVGENLIIHQAETWHFLPKGKLILSSATTEKMVEWRLKGRGNVLEIKYDQGAVEHYNVTTLENGQLVLNFDSDMHVRGIAKLTFEKI